MSEQIDPIRMELSTCGARQAGQAVVCKRPTGHLGVHCSIPELIEAYPEAFAVVERELLDGEYDE